MTSCMAPVPTPVPAIRSLGTSTPVVTPETMVLRVRGAGADDAKVRSVMKNSTL